ncbi:MAG: DUF4012 domain-containing protein [Patescibacteria group bacterium]|nr:DUF4012 domain-containing protein [Patescibacteria group bacterium]MCL5431710.1 DUF4012 domain-containing protein [Patescibacteria group bacterium]
MDEEIKEIKLDSQPTLTPVKPKRSFKKILLAAAAVLVFLGVIVGIPLAKAYVDGKAAYQQTLAVKDAIKSSDLPQAQVAIKATRTKLQAVRGDLKLIGWTSFIPFLGGYTSDANHMINAADYGLQAADVVVAGVEPYADLLGLKGKGTFTGGTAEDRIAEMVQTLGKVTPQIDDVAAKVKLVRQEVDKVDPGRYPGNINSQLTDAKNLIDLADNFLTQARPMVKQLPDMLGANGERKYMVLFQNDKELRPTGGFITAYAIFRVDQGRIHLDSSDDIYKLDDTITKHVAPPDPISRYLNVYGWRLRDSNFSPDFPSSMQVFTDLYNSSSAKQNLNGIIAMDTDVLTKMMGVLGPIDAYGTTFTTKTVPTCDCPMVIYELEQYADQPTNYVRGSRKDIIGVLLQTMMQKAMGSAREVYAPLIQTAMAEATQKHILFYLYNADAQAGVNALGFGGAIKTNPGGDYLHVNDANLAGAKSNLYVTQAVKQEVSVTDTGADVTLTLNYRYPHQADNCSLERKTGLCLAGIYRDYLRVYLPLGATIGEVRGFENTSKTFQDLNHTVVDGFFTVVPEGLAKIQISYKVSGNFKKDGVYKSLIQKQPGTAGNQYTLIVNGKQQVFNLTQDQEISVKL